MAKFKAKSLPVSKSAAADKVAKGKLSPVQANKIKHKADAVLGKNDTAYHNC
jgi:hypothetical protein